MAPTTRSSKIPSNAAPTAASMPVNSLTSFSPQGDARSKRKKESKGSCARAKRSKTVSAAVEEDASVRKLSRSRVPKVARPSNAASKVFSISELHGQILLNLDTKTLLLAQRVNKDWQAKISQTTSLRKKLFLEPATKSELSRLNIVESRDIVMMDHAGNEIDESPIKANNVWKSRPRDSANKNSEVIILNPLLL